MNTKLTRRSALGAALAGGVARAGVCPAEVKEIEYVLQNDTGRQFLKQTVETLRVPLGSDVFLDLVKIPAGRFQRGSPQSANAQPIRQVDVPEFWCGIHEVTREQWRRANEMPIADGVVLGPPPGRWPNDEARERGLPVDLVFHRGALEFCRRVSAYTGLRFRLPSEAEWEYACRAGSTTDYHYGDRFDPELSELGNRTIPEVYGIPVMSRGWPNRFGLWHMHGNAQEWCADIYYPSYENAPVDGSAQNEVPRNTPVPDWVVRGGRAGSTAESGRSWVRHNFSDVTFTGLGFRVALSGFGCSPALTAGGVVHGASLAAGPVCPGMIVSLFGTGLAGVRETASASGGRFPAEHAGTGVRFGNLPGRVLFVSPTQVNALVPFGVEGREVPVVVTRDGLSSEVARLEVAAAAPELFTFDASAASRLAVGARPDWTPVTRERPLAAGEVVTLFGTGAGLATPVPEDGSVSGTPLARFVLAAEVEMGGRAAEILYFGPAPGLVAGVFQLNVRVPAGIPAGDAAIRLRVGGVPSRASVAVPVR